MASTTRKAAAAKPDEQDFEQVNEKVTVSTAPDHAATEKRRLGKEHRERTAAIRAGHVDGLRNELAYLERQPTPNKTRVAAVKAELDRYSDEPDDAEIETA